MRRHALVLLVCCWSLVRCSSAETAAPPVAGGGPVVVTVGSVEVAPYAPVPCAAPSASVVVGESPPAFVAGLATLRVGVYPSKDAAERALKRLDVLVGAHGWKLEVWGTRSGKVPSVRARLQVAEVDPAAAAALCAWLAAKGWDSGPLPCELRRGRVLL